MAHDHAVGNRDKGQHGGPSFAKGVDDSAFQFLPEGLSMHLPNRGDITWLLVSYLNHVVLRVSALARRLDSAVRHSTHASR